MSYGSASFTHGYPMRTSPDIFKSHKNYMRTSNPDISRTFRLNKNHFYSTSPDIPGTIKSQLYAPQRRELPERDLDRGWSKYGLLRAGTFVDVPESDKAKLMYYVACVFSVLDLTNVPNISRMCDFCNYYMLREQETDDLLLLCYKLNPDLFIGKCMFKDEEICCDLQNEFYEMSYFQRKFAMSPTVTVLGEPRRVLKIMFFKLDFLKDNYYYPMLSFKPRVSEILMFEAQGNDYKSRDIHQDIENKKSKTCVIS